MSSYSFVQFEIDRAIREHNAALDACLLQTARMLGLTVEELAERYDLQEIHYGLDPLTHELKSTYRLIAKD